MSRRHPRAAPPLLAATLIVKDEAANLPGCLAALTGLVDEIVVYDTGSRDDTCALARAAGARVQRGYWDGDFSRARNAALDLTRARWALIVDADERVRADVAAVRSLLAGPPDVAADFLLMRVVNVDADDAELDALTSTRIFRRDLARWQGTVHEQVVMKPGSGAPRSLILPSELAHLRHRGYGDRVTARAKSERNLLLAQVQLDALVAAGSQDRQAAARVLLDLGRSFLGAGRRQEAVDAFEALRELVTEGVYRAQATALLCQVLLDEGGLDEAALVLEADLRASGSADPRYCDWLRAQAMSRLGMRDEALDLLRGIDQLIDPVGNSYGIGRVLQVRTLLAASAGRFEEAGAALLSAMLDHGQVAGHGGLLLELWADRRAELQAVLAASASPHAAAVLAELAERSRERDVVVAAFGGSATTTSRSG